MSKLQIVVTGPVENDRQVLAELMFAIGAEIAQGQLQGAVTMHPWEEGRLADKRFDWSVGPAKTEEAAA